MQELKNNPTLKDFQNYVAQMKVERGFNTTDKFYECCLLAEECGAENGCKENPRHRSGLWCSLCNDSCYGWRLDGRRNGVVIGRCKLFPWSWHSGIAWYRCSLDC